MKERECFGLGTSNQAAAAARAVEVYDFLNRHGMKATVEKFKPKAAEKADGQREGAMAFPDASSCRCRLPRR
jgi:hypothetical protein